MAHKGTGFGGWSSSLSLVEQSFPVWQSFGQAIPDAVVNTYNTKLK
jgi:hypothetical protein